MLDDRSRETLIRAHRSAAHRAFTRGDVVLAMLHEDVAAALARLLAETRPAL